MQVSYREWEIFRLIEERVGGRRWEGWRKEVGWESRERDLGCEGTMEVGRVGGKREQEREKGEVKTKIEEI